jgi:hypothetical protein
MTENYNIGDFGLMKFTYRNNHKNLKKYFELYITITAVEKNCIEITDNSDRAYIVLKKDIKKFERSTREMQYERTV